MTPSGTRSIWANFTATIVVGFAASLIGCASAGPLTTVTVSDVKSVAGTWKGVVYRSSFEPDYVALMIREDGSYDVESRRQTIGGSHGKGKVVISEGRLILEGEKGRGVGTLLRNPAGDRFMNIDATLSDNSTVTAELSLSR
jgi:hypothetical protein